MEEFGIELVFRMIYGTSIMSKSGTDLALCYQVNVHLISFLLDRASNCGLGDALGIGPALVIASCPHLRGSKT